MKQIPLVCVLCFGLFATISAEENDIDVRLPDLKNIVAAGPYCGIYSLCAVLDSYDKQPPIEELLKPEFVGSYRGSSATELIQAAEKYGLYGKCYGNMTWRQLQNAKNPMILHFRGSGDSEFNHWVAFLGIEGKLARIVDTPHEMAYLPIAEVLAQWDGVAIVLSDKPVHDEPIWESRFEYLSVVVFLLGGVFLFKIFFWSEKMEPSAAPNRREALRRFCTQTTTMLAAIGFTAILFHSVSEIGFLKNPTAVAEVSRRYHVANVPEISFTEMKKIVAKNDAVIYDARFHRDFEHGAIPGAVGFSINSDLSQRKWMLQDVAKSARIIVYCQSSGCGYADSVASFLKFNGYRNVFLYRGGYREWKANLEPLEN